MDAPARPAQSPQALIIGLPELNLPPSTDSRKQATGFFFSYPLAACKVVSLHFIKPLS